MGSVAFTSPAVRLLAVFLFTFTLFLLYGKTHFYRDPGSIFYDLSRAYEKRYSAIRLQQVEHARLGLDKIHHNGEDLAISRAPNMTVSGASPELCIGMITLKRDGLDRQYIEDTILSMVSDLTVHERSSSHISLLFTDAHANSHPTWHRPWLRQMVDDVWSYDTNGTPVTPEIRAQLQNLTSANNISTKAMVDYSLALERCLTQTHAPYIAIFEGDILLASGWVAPTLQALRSAPTLLRQTGRSWLTSFGRESRSEVTYDWLDMRLFNQERSTGWDSRHIGGNNELAIIFAIDLLLVALRLSLRRRITRPLLTIDHGTLAVLTLLVVPIIVVAFFQSGKASLLPPSPGLQIANFGCCSQALVFNRKHVGGLIEYLRDIAVQEAEGAKEQEGYDMRTRDYARENKLDRLTLYPIMAQHLGVKSAMSTTESEARSVWSMAFEDLDEVELKRRHDRAMTEVYGKDWAP